MSEKKRLDLRMVELGLAPSREKAKAIIMSGDVFVDGERCDKAGVSVAVDSKIEITGSHLKYVSRGGLKLEKAMQKYTICLNGKICMDIGASTGGFSDCMLQNGAEKIYAVDVGYGQLAWSLRNDPRVVNLERTNVRYLTEQQVPDRIDFASIDVSFISVTLVLPVLKRFLVPGGEVVCLIKPQFEAGKGKVGKKGVVREENIHLEVLRKVLDFCKEQQLCVLHIDFSPIKGPEGNIEYLYHLKYSDQLTEYTDQDLEHLVKESHRVLNGSEV